MYVVAWNPEPWQQQRSSYVRIEIERGSPRVEGWREGQTEEKQHKTRKKNVASRTKEWQQQRNRKVETGKESSAIKSIAFWSMTPKERDQTEKSRTLSVVTWHPKAWQRRTNRRERRKINGIVSEPWRHISKHDGQKENWWEAREKRKGSSAVIRDISKRDKRVESKEI